ncbi:hypothetical protein HY837_03435 [archaeon]|nr:hypothetical protein [archaeon]
MEQKKRHNPPITQEDLAVKAFDRLDDIVKKADPSSVDVVKTENALNQQLNGLISKIFSQNIYHRVYADIITQDDSYSKEVLQRFGCTDLNMKENSVLILLKKEKQKWYQRTKTVAYVTLEVDLPEQKIRTDYGEEVVTKKFIQNNNYSPIKITAHTPEALKQARIFAAAYKELTKQKAAVIQDCADEEAVNKTEVKEFVKLEEKIVDVVKKEPTKNVKVIKEMGNISGRILKETGKGFWKGTKWSLSNIVCAPFIAPTKIRQIYEGNDRFCNGKLSNSVMTYLFLPMTTMFAHTAFIALSIPAAINDHWEVPAIYFGANAASGMYELYRYSKNKVEEEERWIK